MSHIYQSQRTLWKNMRGKIRKDAVSESFRKAGCQTGAIIRVHAELYVFAHSCLIWHLKCYTRSRQPEGTSHEEVTSAVTSTATLSTLLCPVKFLWDQCCPRGVTGTLCEFWIVTLSPASLPLSLSPSTSES